MNISLKRIIFAFTIAALLVSAVFLVPAVTQGKYKLLTCDITTPVSNAINSASVKAVNIVYNINPELGKALVWVFNRTTGVVAAQIAYAGGCYVDSDCAYGCSCSGGTCVVPGCNGVSNTCPWCCSCDNGGGSHGPVTCVGLNGERRHYSIDGCAPNPTNPPPQPTNTPVPTATPQPTATPVPPTNTPRPQPTDTAKPGNPPPKNDPTSTPFSGGGYSRRISCTTTGVVPGEPVCRWYAMDYIGQVLGDEVDYAPQELNYFVDLPRNGEFTHLVESLSVQMDWYQSDLWCNSNGRRFCPNRNLTRGEAARWCELVAYGPKNEGSYFAFFEDVTSGYKWARAISHITQRGIYVIGLGPDMFDPSSRILGGQFMTLMNLCAEARN